MSSIGDFDVDDLQAIAGELMAVKALDLDLDLAFNLQLQEVMTASLSLQHLPSTSAASSPPQLSLRQPSESISRDVQSDELLKLEQELKDRIISETEFRKLKDDLQLRVHDHRVALEMSRMPDKEWEDWGDNFERPFGEGTSEGTNDEIFRIYFKGLVETQSDGTTLGGIGVALCDSRDYLLFELRKPVAQNGLNRRITELLALIEGLNAALNLELKRVAFYCDYYPIFNFVTGKWSSKQRNVAALVNQVSQLQQKFVYCQASIVPRNDIKFAFRFARESIVSQLSKRAESSVSKKMYETCVICFEDSDISEIFSIDICKHRYCFSCMKQHVEVRLLHGMLPTCPHEGCKNELKIESCRIFLTARQIEIMTQRSKEASVPVTEKVYCPYPKCSALMSKREVLEFSNSSILGGNRSGERKCVKCNSHFCINCKVPWHKNMTCLDYKRRNPYPQIDESRLKNLAATNMWRQCVKCNHMIELATGCYHMTCRCGYEFCYTCGAEWKNKKATCSCPLWDEENILEEDEEDELEDEYYDSDEENILEEDEEDKLEDEYYDFDYDEDEVL